MATIITHSITLVKQAMNLVLFESAELQDGRLRLRGRRAEHIKKILRLEVGDTLRVGMVNGKMGRGVIIAVDNSLVEVEPLLDVDPPPVPDVELILALPRPIMLKRILKQATVLGVRGIHLLRSAKVEKSFFHSPVLQPDTMRSLVQEGLEQAVDTRHPEITLHHRFKPFVEDVLPELSGKRLIAHPGCATCLSRALPAGERGESIILAIGPEGGWNDFEMECFIRQGFTGFSMGGRILHVDTAVVALLAQLQILRESDHG